jgi:hypothetical protein
VATIKQPDKLVCDLCGKEVPGFAGVGETKPAAITGMVIAVYYGQSIKPDICQECSDRILQFLRLEYDLRF